MPEARPAAKKRPTAAAAMAETGEVPVSNKTQRRMDRMQRQAGESQKTKMIASVSYMGPTIITHAVEKNGNNCVITNDSHSKSTNNGFKRGDAGRFYCHWTPSEVLKDIYATACLSFDVARRKQLQTRLVNA